MPDKSKLNYFISKEPQDIGKVRLPGTDKPFDKMTIGELAQMRPGGDLQDSYGVEGVGSNLTIHTSSLLSQLADSAARVAINREIVASKVRGPVAEHIINTKFITK